MAKIKKFKYKLPGAKTPKELRRKVLPLMNKEFICIDTSEGKDMSCMIQGKILKDKTIIIDKIKYV